MAFAENLQYLRKKQKLTQEELADLLQVSRQSVSKWETGEAYPETEKLISICDKFGVTLDRLVRGDVTDDSKADGATDGERIASDANGAGNSEASEQIAAAEAKESNENGDKAKKQNLSQVLGNSFGGLIMISCVVAYLCMGFIAGLWHPGWIVFLGGITLCTILGSFFANDGDEDESEEERKRGDYEPNFKEKLFGGLAAASMMAATTVYLCIGFIWGLWHPGWIAFIIGGALSGLFGALAKYFSTNKDASTKHIIK